ncbi:hypothetical protein [uncultured Mediterranean phage uvMED]|nr:hypothetical protein [uncultured Mediterranean phage uvMED]|tara:strand:- start:285 stop:749 length:465 start_codon:yes stop_codon:yes gene_type:complete
MFELLTLFLTGGGSAAMGSILKGVFGAVTDARSQKHEMEMARECRNNENAIQFQQALSNVPGGAFTRATRRMLALIGMCTLSFITCVTTIYPSVPLISTTNITGEGKKEFLFGLISFPAEQAPLVVTTGHIALFEATVVLPLIIGFYFTPGGRR